MYNPFRHNAKVNNDLEPSLWQKIQFGALMVWMSVKSKVGSALSWLCDRFGAIAFILFIAGIIGLLVWMFVSGEADRKATQHKLETAPCSEFANNTMNNVPIRCLPSNNK